MSKRKEKEWEQSNLTDVAFLAIRPLTAVDEPFLWEMLYQAIHIPEGVTPPERDIVYQPELAKYVRDWGRPGDYGFVAIDTANNCSVGAAWLRLWTQENKGYGYVDNATPELSIAVLPEYRGKGIGSRLLTRLIEAAQIRYSAISLSVSPDNPALRLYQRFGFEEIDRCGTSLTMLKVFT